MSARRDVSEKQPAPGGTSGANAVLRAGRLDIVDPLGKLQTRLNRSKKIPQWLRHIALPQWTGRQSAPIVLSTSLDMSDNPSLATIIGAKIKFHSRIMRAPPGSQLLGWGRKRSGRRAVNIAHKCGGGFILLEDGFLRSVDRNAAALSLVIDNIGIYYDANTPSLLETFVSEPGAEESVRRATDLIGLWQHNRVSKYNDAREFAKQLPVNYALVIDQVRDDLSIKYGCSGAQSFQQMLNVALTENPGIDIVVKLHPDVFSKASKGHFDPQALNNMHRVHVIAENCHPVRLIENAEVVYTVTSQVGFEALIWGKRVRTFGMPFYAGWGLTTDELPAPQRRGKATLQQLVYAVLVRYPRYIDPVTNQLCEVERAIQHIALQRQMRLQFPCQITAIGFSRWKSPFVAQFLQGAQIKFKKSTADNGASAGQQTVAVWGSRYRETLGGNTKILRLEDGFLRSSGLGADLVRPLSLVIDDMGLYYDATRPSRLEHILNSQALSAEQLQRAQQLRRRIIELNLTKYNVGTGQWQRPQTRQKIILVAGQVESDASIEFGCREITTNLELLKAVRLANPAAYIVYKPHPDVVAGLRKKGGAESQATIYCDEMVTSLCAHALFKHIDELHTMTSLIGFEALLRGVPVVCYGLPFYAGWGLTEDRIACARRNRKLTLDELVFGALISYPRYFNFANKIFVEPEYAIDELAALVRSGVRTRRWYRKALRLLIMIWVKMRTQDRP